MTAIVIALSISGSSAPGGAATPSGVSGAQRLVVVPRVAGAVHSGAADTQLPGRVTAKVAPETAAVSEMGRVVDQLTLSETGCWLWEGPTTQDGYGLLDGKRDKRTHRLAYEFFREPIPVGLTIDHLCRVRNCANPWHMEAVTNKVNVLRGEGHTAINARKTHCVHGHEFDLLNTYWSQGKRHCKTCRANREKGRTLARSAKRKAAREAKAENSETCRSARIAAVYFRFRTWTHQELRDGKLASKSPIVAGKSCHWAKFAAREWAARARSARRSFYRWLHDRTLRDFAFAPGADAWPQAVREVQRVFPGTEGWLLSCSAAEGGHGRWVGYGGQGYSIWLRDSDTVGGPLQFRYSTFTGMFRRAVDHVYAHGFRVPVFTSYTAAWRSALGQALAGGWARWSGNDNSHWSASWGSGC